MVAPLLLAGAAVAAPKIIGLSRAAWVALGLGTAATTAASVYDYEVTEPTILGVRQSKIPIVAAAGVGAYLLLKK